MGENDELYHHGVKGQKWGERNGPPYPLESNVSKSNAKRKFDTGKITEKAKSAANSIKKSVKSVTDSAKEKAAERKEKSDAEKERKKEVEEQTSAKKKDPSKMTNDELKEAISRMNLEKAYNSTYNSLHPQTVSKGKQFMSNLGTSLGNAATESVKTVAKDWMTKTLKKGLGLSDDDDTKKEAEKLKNEFQVKNYTDKINELDAKAAAKAASSEGDTSTAKTGDSSSSGNTSSETKTKTAASNNNSSFKSKSNSKSLSSVIEWANNSAAASETVSSCTALVPYGEDYYKKHSS